MSNRNPIQRDGSAEIVQRFDAAMMTPPWFQADITQANSAALMDNLAGSHPLSPAPQQDLYAPGTTTRRDSHAWGSGSAEHQTAGVSDSIEHRGKGGLHLSASTRREQTQYADGSYTYDHQASVVSRQARRPLFGRGDR